MSLDSKEKSRIHFDNEAQTYETSGTFDHPLKNHPFIVDTINSFSFTSLLDIGCGTGIVLETLSKTNPHAQLFGLDLSEKMIEQARQRLGSHADLKQGDAEDLPYPDKTFDVVSCSASFHHYPNPIKAVSEVRRVLKPDGVYVLSDMLIPTPFHEIVNITMPRFSRGCDLHAYSEKELRNILSDAGFTDIHWKKTPAHNFICTAQ